MGKPRSYLPANAVGAVENSHSANNHGGRMAKLERYAAISLAPAAADRADPRSGIPRPNDVDGTDPASLPRRPFGANVRVVDDPEGAGSDRLTDQRTVS